MKIAASCVQSEDEIVSYTAYLNLFINQITAESLLVTFIRCIDKGRVLEHLNKPTLPSLYPSVPCYMSHLLHVWLPQVYLTLLRFDLWLSK